MKKTALYDEHVKQNAKIVEFSGFMLPVSYSSIIKEHEAVRNKAGIFDVSHMGQLFVSGENSLSYLQHLCTNDISAIGTGKVIYTLFCNEKGGTVDDLIVYRISDSEYMCVVNAANTEKDYEWMKINNHHGVLVKNLSAEYSQIALQGPDAERIIQKLPGIASLPAFFSFITVSDMIISRTGYTGEDGFELYMKNEKAPGVWNSLIDAGAEPAGLGARDTLRFEASLTLYGHELTEEISPVEAGLSYFIKPDKITGFIGQHSVKDILQNRQRFLIGLQMLERGIAREGYEVLAHGQKAGYVTSGSYCPTLGNNLAMALIDADYKDTDNFEVIIRNNSVKAKKVKMPFYKKRYKR